MLSNFGESISSVSDRSDKDGFTSAQAQAEQLAQLSRALHEIAAQSARRPRLNLIDLAPLSDASRRMMEALREHPEKLAGLQGDLTRRIMGVVQEMIEETPSTDLDRSPRYADPAWRDNPYFDMSRRLHAAIAGWLVDMPETTPGLSSDQVKVLQFWARQVGAATSPANSLITNPRAMAAMTQSQGESLNRAAEALAASVDPQTGRVRVRQTDCSAFKIGADLAATPGKIVFRNELIELICFDPTTDRVRRNPVLIFPPWINKYYVLDLAAEKSLVAWLRDQGLVVYMVSWRSGGPQTRDFDWDDYLEKGALAALDQVHQRHEASVNAVGYCAGGTLLSTLAAWLSRRDDQRIGSISLLAAQTDFSDPGDLSVFLTPRAVDLLEAEIARSDGLMRGEIMADAFNMLRPSELVWRYVEENFLLGHDPEPFDLLFWNADQTHIPGPLHLTNLRRLYLENALSEDRFGVFGEDVGLSDLTYPAFVQAAERDHISPAESVYRGARKFGGGAHFILSESGHIAGVVNPPASGKYGYWTGDDALSAPSARIWAALGVHRAGSWWPNWLEWLTPYLGDYVAPTPLDPDLPEAPGDYVRTRI